MDNDGFTIVKRSHKGRASRPPPGGHSKGKSVTRLAYDTREQGKSTQTTATMEEKLEKLLAILQTRRRQLLEDEQGSGKGKTFLKRWEDQMVTVRSTLTGGNDTSGPSTSSQKSPIIRIICLGIGIINESRESQFQFILLEMLKEALGVSSEDLWIYDPLFQPVDLALLESRGYQLIPQNECGKHKLDLEHHTLVYMPHCPGKLYDAFLRANWDRRIVCASPESQVNEGEKQEVAAQRRAGGVILLANDFRGYIENAPRSQIENELPSVYRLTPHLSRIPFPSLSSSHIASNAFNSLVFQYLGSQAAKEVDWFTSPPVGCDKDSATETEVIVGEIKGELERMKISPPRKEELAALNDGAGSSEEHDGYTGQDALRDEFRNETEG